MIQPDKDKLRSQMKAIRATPGPEERQEHALATAELLLQAFPGKKHWLLYKATGTEAILDTLAQRLLQLGMDPAFPRISERELVFHTVHNLETDLETGPYSILQPSPQRPALYTFSHEDIVCVPGLAFDACGYRLGYGGGYYDRFLPGFPGITVGILFAQQKRKTITVFAHDYPVQYLCDGTQLIKTERSIPCS